MDTLNFQEEIDRAGTGSVKWGLIQDLDDHKKWLPTQEYFASNPILPMWVADMDFRCPEPVVKALIERSNHGIYGYTMADENYLSAIISWMKNRHDWDVDSDWIVTSPGVVPALHMLVQALSCLGDNVIIQRPVYYPFFSAIENNGRNLLSNSLLFDGERYEIDWQDLEQKLKLEKSKLFILCSPHNPVGRVWQKDELLRLGRLCREHHVIVIADEIHGDLVFKGNNFIPFASLDNFSEFTVTCTAPSKTFNLAGLQTSNIIISDPVLRDKFQKVMSQNGLMGVNPFGAVACQAAYTEGAEWLDKAMATITSNVELVNQFFIEQLPEFKLVIPEGTYLLWFDCRSLGLDHLVLREKFLGNARIFLDDGFIFGDEGKGFQRMNVACPTKMVVEALARMKKVFCKE